MSKPIINLVKKFQTLVSDQGFADSLCENENPEFIERFNTEVSKFEALLEYVQDWVPDENPWADIPKDWSNWPWE